MWVILHFLSVINNIWTWSVNGLSYHLNLRTKTKTVESKILHEKQVQNVNCYFESEQGGVSEGHIEQHKCH